MTDKPRTALFAGSFRPFTIGHKSIADRALASLCDRLVIAVGRNSAKSPGAFEQEADSIRKVFAGDPRVEVMTYSGLTVETAKEVGADFMVRGVRGVTDYDYERNLAETNLMISGIETVLIPALPRYSCISSSMVRELMAHGADVSAYLP